MAILDGKLAGIFLVKDNEPGLGSHVANASYMTHPDFTGKGIGETMGVFSLSEAKKLGCHAMQFNLVVKTNFGTVRLWEKLGFQIIGEIPGAFRHNKFGMTNAYIMYRKL